MELYLTDEEAKRLIKMIKEAFKKYNVCITDEKPGEILFCGLGGEKNGLFRLVYKFKPNYKVLQFMECKYDYTLFRINLNNNFHKNADGTKIWGNRINIFSAQEFKDKGDHHTHYKAYPLPYKEIRNSDDFFEVFSDMLDFAHIIKNENLNISVQENLV